MTDTKKPERTDKYWICDACAKERGWTCEANGITVIAGLCGWCDEPEEVVLTPVRDFKKPGKRLL